MNKYKPKIVLSQNLHGKFLFRFPCSSSYFICASKLTNFGELHHIFLSKPTLIFFIEKTYQK